ncbi:MAG: hypothetical protein ABIF85_02215 [Nanoarchaeota archaeon]|nr:hypothetical protein [Nanoarchaeota archaeon]MBU4300414.1 hypothetical protein [Nanoarchaeota archaeon]MBU4451366.1 hypothetical protein [Nanoarchaeota archaeon]MCG2723769.1 hypothetical protein [archaeon]
MSFDFKEVFAPDWKKVLFSFVLLFLVLYFAPCKVSFTQSMGNPVGYYWSVCSNMISFSELMNPEACGVQFSFFGILEFSDRMLLGLSFSILIIYAVSYIVSSLIVFYFKGMSSRNTERI